jgi:hypothetical protein
MNMFSAQDTVLLSIWKNEDFLSSWYYCPTSCTHPNTNVTDTKVDCFIFHEDEGGSAEFGCGVYKPLPSANKGLHFLC